MIRISAGRYKGKNILGEKLKNVRPTTDKVRQAIFNKLQNSVLNTNILDLFAGTGSMGIEALSRGAKHVTFIDNNLQSIKVLKQNLYNVENYTLTRSDAITFLKNCSDRFDVIFVDPPYKSGLYENAVYEIFLHNLLNDDGLIVVECAKEDIFDFGEFVILDEKVYGSTKICYLYKKNN